MMAFSVITARILSPKEFGIIAVANMVTAFGGLVTKLGLSATIIQKKEISNAEISASFTVSLLISFLIYIFIAFNVRFLETYFKIEGLANIILVLSTIFILQSFVITSTSILERNLDYFYLSKVELISPIIGKGIITVCLAIVGFGVWSIVYGMIITQLISTILLTLKNKEIFKLTFKKSSYINIYNYAIKYSLVQLVDYIYGNSNTFFISKYFGTNITGIFERSSTFVRLPISNIIVGVNRVMFPLFSRMQEDNKASGKIFLSNLIILGGAISLMAGSLIAVAEEIIHLLLGDKWIMAVTPFKYLAVFSCFEYLASIMFSPLDSNNRLQKRMIFKLIPLGIRIVLYYFIFLQGYSFTFFLFAITAIEFLYFSLYSMEITRLFHFKTKDILFIIGFTMANILIISFLLLGIKMVLNAVQLPYYFILFFVPFVFVGLFLFYLEITKKLGYINIDLNTMFKNLIKTCSNCIKFKKTGS